jgi:hypothetical protein
LHYYVGGNSKVYGAALFRLLPADFGEVRHPDGVAPAWPLSYQRPQPLPAQDSGGVTAFKFRAYDGRRWNCSPRMTLPAPSKTSGALS